MKTNQNKHLVTMSNALIRSSFKLTVNELRLLLAAISQMPKVKPDEEPAPLDPMQPYYITKDDFIRLGVDPKNVSREIRAACSELLDRKVFIDTPIGVLGTHWVYNVLHFKSELFEELKQKYPNSKYDEEFINTLRMHNLLDSLPIIANSHDNIVARVVFHPDILPHISQLRSHFTQFNIEDTKGFNSFYSFRIYILIMQFKSTGRIIITLDDCRTMLDLNDKYKAAKDLRKRVLDTAIDEISEKSPYTATYELTDKSGRTGRGVNLTHLCIIFDPKDKKKASKTADLPPARDPDTPDLFTGLTDAEREVIQSEIDKCISRLEGKGEQISDFHRQNITKKAIAERWGVAEYEQRQKAQQQQEWAIRESIRQEQIEQQERQKQLELENRKSQEFIQYFESLPVSQQNMIYDQISQNLQGVLHDIFVRKRQEKTAHKDPMFRQFFDHVMNL